MNFNVELKTRIAHIDEVLNSFLPPAAGYQQIVQEAMRYSVLGGGKRIRPILIHETYLLCGGRDCSITEPFMAAMELIHTYSLIHDDLPAMDDDEYRRGRKTTHVVYGEAVGILAGDALLNYAFEIILQQIIESEDSKKMARAAAILARKSGVFGMIGGQTADVVNTGLPLDTRKLDFIYSLKTGALIEASMMIGAVLADSDDQTISLMEETASEIGRAFQIRDDILDLTGTMEEIGKPVLSDEKNKKTTFVTLNGLNESESEVRSLSSSAIDKLNSMDRKNDFLIELIRYLTIRNK
ncbi:polyprenyl synthetase family protein [Parasporobacterium paucivorans]|uniref:Farnesyl diphosphate synthase n=1 Tax=Parasporobacterium paucivorans DSM 15970 TaxID=1122934 RepID=A0A1M6FAQ8_9FIRM|nr:farnesyl diphosphate synthase [Parasporobacterium paucivorans]SHI94834.1 geranylgeranyl diphosphate synthase, type II [Parasporobacterium paucivorans DSM 15970]